MYSNYCHLIEHGAAILWSLEAKTAESVAETLKVAENRQGLEM